MKTKFLIVGLLAALLFFGLKNNVLAYEIEHHDDNVEDRFIVSPGKLVYELTPGSKVQGEMFVVNRLGKKTDFFIKKDVLIDMKEDPEASVAGDWVTTDVEKFTLEHGDRIKINLKISVPANAKSRGYYFTFLVGTKGEKTSGKDQLQLVSQVGQSVLITVKGENVKESGVINEFSSDKFFYRVGPVKLKSIFENTGNIHLQPQGEVTITNLLGAKVAQIPLKEALVFPSSTVEQWATWDKHLIMGRYRADLVIHYGKDGSQSLTSSVVFYAFPWHLLLLLIAIIIVLYYSIKWLRSKFEVTVRKADALEKTNTPQQDDKKDL